MEEYAVKLEGIKKTYKARGKQKSEPAVSDVSLKVRSGEIFGLLGPNGAGKTTTIKIMLGLVYPDEGEGTILGSSFGDVKVHERIGFLPEQPYFYPFLTAEKALDLYGKFFGIEPERRRKRIKEVLLLVGLESNSYLTLSKYSKGMLQRFGIAQALVNEPDFLILDEPSSGLDPIGQIEVRDLLLKLKEEGKAIFLSSHQLSEVENICDAVSIVAHGKTVMAGKLDELLQIRGIAKITFVGEDPILKEALAPLAVSLTAANDATIAEVPNEKLYAAIEEARKVDAKLYSVEPKRRSLEDLFLEAVRSREA
ncbi:MAG: ABC transporter ATP-binding protein [Actinomycetota bacterium]|nr:ABC transporter ATP-binding protein [Actinomycetota bacterium]